MAWCFGVGWIRCFLFHGFFLRVVHQGYCHSAFFPFPFTFLGVGGGGFVFVGLRVEDEVEHKSCH